MSSSEPDCCELADRWEPCDICEVRVNDPLLGMEFWWFAGLQVMIKFELFATYKKDMLLL